MKSRIQSSKKNIVYGAAGKIARITAKFLIRTVIIQSLGAAYLGLDGLFLNVVSVLSIAEMGISSAICFSLYKPIVQNNSYEMQQYLQLYKKIYTILGWFMLLIGLAITPFLQFIVNFPDGLSINYQLIYVLFLLSTVSTYWFGAYKSVIFTADQSNYVVTNVQNAVYCVAAIVQVVALLCTNNYYLYLIISIACNVVTNLVLSMFAEYAYPQVFSLKPNPLSDENRHELFKNVYGLALTKIATVIYTSSDNIVISVFVGTVVVGYYSNYLEVVSGVTGVISILFSGILSSIGNVNASGDRDKMYDVFKKMLFANMWIYGVCFTCLMQLFQDFIALWAGKDYLFGNSIVYLIGLMFLLPGLGNTCTIYKDACGLFWQTRYRACATALMNIVVSIILAARIGIAGVFIGTIVSFLTTTLLYDSRILYNEKFEKNVKHYYFWFCKSVVYIVLINLFIGVALRWLVATSWSMMLLKSVICFAAVNGIYLLLFRKLPECRYFMEFIKNEWKKRK